MKKIIGLLVLVISLSLTSCEDASDVRSELDILKAQRVELRKDVQNYGTIVMSLESQVRKHKEKLIELDMYDDGKAPKYILKLRLKQSHFTLDIGKHMKDKMNAIEFELPVDREFYETMCVGSVLLDKFRSGSFILNGSLGNWEMTVIDKRIM